MSQEYPNQPYVGMLLNYYPDNQTRLCAICTEVHSIDDLNYRPSVNLAIFNPDATIDQGEDIEPVNAEDASDNPNDTTLEGKWSFPHEFLLHITEEDQNTQGTENPIGTKTNLHVGEVFIQQV
jgi:hypothetical protein